MEALSEIVPGSPIRIFLLIENRVLREALIRLFRKRSDLLVVGQGVQVDATACQPLDPPFDVLVIDSCEVDWLSANLDLESGRHAAFKAILIGMESNEEPFLAAVRAGVTGYLLQDASASDVVAAVRAVFRGEAVCSPQLCSVLFRSVAQMS